MKKTMMTAAAFVLTLALGTTAFAAGPSAAQANNTANTRQNNAAGTLSGGCAFVDADNDGICDNQDTHCQYADANGDGVCDNRGTHCKSFSDADNDGICDSCKNPYAHGSTGHSNGGGNGTDSGSGHGSGSRGSGHHGRNHH